jgi:hypothetical protein
VEGALHFTASLRNSLQIINYLLRCRKSREKDGFLVLRSTALGPRSRKFESCHPDSELQTARRVVRDEPFLDLLNAMVVDLKFGSVWRRDEMLADPNLGLTHDEVWAKIAQRNG